MKPSVPSEKAFKFETTRQERIFKGLRLIGFAPATYYRDACRLATVDPPLDSITHLVAHLFREIEGTIVDFLLDETDRKALTNQEGARKLKIRAVLRRLGVQNHHDISKLWLESASFHGLAHRNGIIKPRVPESDFDEIVQKFEEILDYVLHRYESHYAEYHGRLDDLVREAKPTKRIMTELRNYVPNNVVSLIALFERLSDAAWLPFLSESGFLEGPPDPEPDPETGDRTYPRWPAGGYLIRMAPQKPREVMNILLGVNDKLNPYAQWALIEAATQMPPREAARIVPKVKEWLQTKRDRLLIPDCVKLVIFLAEGRCLEETIELAQELFLVPDGSADSHFGADDLAWYYDNALKKVAPRLIGVLGLQALSLFCDLLDQALKALLRHSIGGDGSDHSYSWRARIEQNPDRNSHDIRNVFITAVRDCAVSLARNDPQLLASIVGLLEGRSWLIFHRLALHVLCEFPDQSLEVACSRLKEFRRYDDPHLYNEYFRLARTAFPLLRDPDKEEILTAIQTGPDFSEVRYRLDESGEETTAESLQRKIREDTRDSLGELRPLLDETRKSLLAELEVELGPSVPKVMPRPDYDAWGHVEPEETLEWETATVEEIVSFLHNWGPCPDTPRRSPDRTCKRLLRATSTAPEKFAREALRFTQVDPTYLTHLFRGFRAALEAKPLRAFEWDQVIALCSWVVSNGREIPGRAVETFYWDRDWGSSRREIVHLVDAGLRICQEGIPFHLRDQVWSVVERLTTDPEPTEEDERQLIGGGHDPLPLVGDGLFADSGTRPGDVAINTIRCLAITAVISYAIWVRRDLSQHEGDEHGFEQMPEARKALEHHLDSQNENSIAVAFVYGSEIRSLYALDPIWSENNIDLIFPRGITQRERRAAAWEGFLMSQDLHPQAFDVLREQYEQAVEDRGKPASETGHFVDLDLRLGEHLCELYHREKVFLGTPGSIWERFLENASDEVLGRLFMAIGWRLSKEEKPHEKRLEKLREIAKWRIQRIQAKGASDTHQKELAALGTWFGSGKFDDTWALRILGQVLAMNGRVEDGKRVINRLAKLVNQFPTDALGCAILLSRGITRGATLYYWRDDLKTIISAVRNAGDCHVQQQRKELMSILMSKGFTEFD